MASSTFKPIARYDWLSVFVVLMGTMPARASGPSDRKHVLLLHSFGHANKYSQLQETGFRSAFLEPNDDRASIKVENLDITSTGDFELQLESNSRSFRAKSHLGTPDLIVTTDTPALQWVLEYNADLFAGTPIVFSALVPNRVDLTQWPEITGIMENVDPRSTIELIQRLHPYMTKLIIVRDRLEHSVKLEQMVDTVLNQMSSPPRIEWAIGLSSPELREFLTSLNGTTPVLLLSHHPSLGKQVPESSAFSFDSIAKESGAPIYSIYDAYFGRGIVGGKLASGEVSGHRAGLMAKRILFDGEKANTVPILPSATVYMFDARQLSRWNIAESSLPPGSIIQFRAQPLFALYRSYVIGGVVVFAIEAAIILLLIRSIARRKRAEHELRENRRQWQTVFEDAPVGIGRANPDGRLLDVNPTLVRILGYTREQLLSGTFMDVTHPLDIEKSLELCHRVLAKCGETQSIEKRYIRADGSTIWCHLTASAIRDEHQQVSYIIAAIQDITDRKTAMEAAEKQFLLCERIINTAAEGICLWHEIAESPYCRFVIWNRRMTELTGYTMDEINSRGWYQTVYADPIDQARAKARMFDSITGHDLRQEQRVITQKDGDQRTITISTSSVDTPEGVRGVVAVMQDITERERMEQELRKSESHYRLITESMDDIISLHDLTGRYLYASSSMFKATGFTPEELIGLDVYELIHPDDRQRVRVDAHEPVLKGTPKYIEWRMRHKNGTYQWMQTRTSLVRSAEGRPESLLCCTRDITSRKLAEDKVVSYAKQLETFNEAITAQKNEAEALNNELKLLAIDLDRANKESMAANKSKSEFLANMSHEIRTPMAAILGFSENLLDDHLSPLEKDSAVEAIRRNGEHLLSIINDILDLSKIEAGRMKVDLVNYSTVELVQEAFAMMKVRADSKKLALNLQFATAVPQEIRTDPLRLRQVLINLLGNAIKFTEEGSVLLVVSVLRGSVTQLCFDVIDTGIGMSSEQSAELFKAFTQVDTSMTRRFGGTGLGLVISARIAALLEGELSVVKSAPGQGTTFRLTIPAGVTDDGQWVKPDRITALDRRKPNADAPLEAGTLVGRRILVAEDSADNQRLIEHILKLAGAEVIVVENGQAAVVAAMDSSNHFDVILMDMQMPILDGYAATKQLREMGYTGTIIALTAHAMVEDRKRCIDAGCDEYATKPINRALLLGLLSKPIHASSPA